MTSTTLSADITRVAVRRETIAYWALRIGAACCFIGHGAFGFITKATWVPYFGVVGIRENVAYALMPLVGAVDVLAGMSVLFAPRAGVLAYMAVWAVWTALLRPLTGEPVWEALERAGNYGVPFALLVLTGMPRSWRELFRPSVLPLAADVLVDRVRRILQGTTALLLFGHGALGAFSARAFLARHYAAVDLPLNAIIVVGWTEIAMAVLVLLRPSTPLLFFVAAWKVTSESLWIASGSPPWEFVERAGSYAAPLAWAVLMLVQRNRTAPHAANR